MWNTVVETTRIADPRVTSEQTREPAAELTTNKVLFEPIDGLAIDTDTETLVPSPARRASVSAASPPAEVSPRSRQKSALHGISFATK